MNEAILLSFGANSTPSLVPSMEKEHLVHNDAQERLPSRTSTLLDMLNDDNSLPNLMRAKCKLRVESLENCHDNFVPPKICSPLNQFFDKYGPPRTYFTQKVCKNVFPTEIFGPPTTLLQTIKISVVNRSMLV